MRASFCFYSPDVRESSKMIFHSCGITGCTESRCPRLSNAIPTRRGVGAHARERHRMFERLGVFHVDVHPFGLIRRALGS